MAMQALGEATAWPEALKLLQLQHRQTDQLCLNAAMRALELSGEWCQALQLLEEMVSLKRFQEVVPLTMAMGACKRAREWAAALWVLQDLMPALQIDTWHEFARRGVFRREAVRRRTWTCGLSEAARSAARFFCSGGPLFSRQTK
eukprot:g20626.t1